MPSANGYLSSLQFSRNIVIYVLCIHLQEFLCLIMELSGWYMLELLDNDKLLYMVDTINTTTGKGEKCQDVLLPFQHFCLSGGYKIVSPCDSFILVFGYLF